MKPHRNDFVRSLKHLRKLEMIDYKGGRCQVCGEGRFPCLTFHHVDPGHKTSHIGLLLGGSIDKLVEEVDKTVLICENCHRVHHAGDRDYYYDWILPFK